MSAAATKQPQKEKKSLSDVFESFAADTATHSPRPQGRLLIMDMNEYKAYGAFDIDRKATGLTPEKALDFLTHHPVTREMEDNRNESSCHVRNKRRRLDIIFINEHVDETEYNNITKETEAAILYALEHEWAHSAIKNAHNKTGTLHDGIIAEAIADAYAMMRHYQRFGADSAYRDKNTDPFVRAHNMIFGNDTYHFTSFVLDEIVKRRHEIDFNGLDRQQTMDLARRFVMAYTLPAPAVKDLHRIFKPVRTAPKPRAEESVKALINITLDPKSDYHTFKLGSLWLDRFLETRALPNGKPTTLPQNYLDGISKKLKEREFRLAAEDILFNIPTVARKPPASRAALRAIKGKI